MREYKGKITERELHPSLLERLLSQTNDNIYAYYGSYIVDRPTNTIPIPIEKYNGPNDILIVYKNGTYIREDFDYAFDSIYSNIVKNGQGNWNTTPGQITKFEFIAIKNIKRLTKLSEIQFLNNSISINKLDPSITQGLVPAGGHKGSYLVKTSDNDFEYAWKDFTTFLILLTNPSYQVTEEFTIKMVDKFTNEESLYTISGGVLNINDIKPGDYKVYLFANNSFSPKEDSYDVTINPNEQSLLNIEVVEKEHTFQLQVSSDVEISSPVVLITDLVKKTVYEHTLTGTGTVISKMVTLPSGEYKAELSTRDQSLKQLNEVRFTISRTNTPTLVDIDVLNSYRTVNLNLNFKPIIGINKGLDSYIPLFENDELDLNAPGAIREINKGPTFTVRVKTINQENGEESISDITGIPEEGIDTTHSIFVQNNTAYKIMVSVIDGDNFVIKGSEFNIAGGTEDRTVSTEIYENSAFIKFMPQVIDRALYKGSKGVGRRFYDVLIYRAKNSTFTDATLYKKIKYVTPDTVIKLEASYYYRLTIVPDNKLNTFQSKTIALGVVKHNVGASTVNMEEDVTDCVVTYEPIITYGFSIDPSNSDPFSCVTYTDDCAEFIPVRRIHDNIDLGSWTNTVILNGITPVILKPSTSGVTATELSKDNQSVEYNRVLINDDFLGDFMVRFQKMYYTFKEHLDGTIDFKICTIKKSPEYEAIAFSRDEVGAVVEEYFYYGMYEASIVNNNIRSLPNKTISTDRSLRDLNGMITSRSSRYGLEDYTRRLYINCLLVLLGKSLDSQLLYGKGNVNSAGINETGLSAEAPMISGNTSFVKTLYIENLWGNSDSYIMGLVNERYNLRYKRVGPYSGDPLDYDVVHITTSETTFHRNDSLVLKKCGAVITGMFPQFTGASTNYYSDECSISRIYPFFTMGGNFNDNTRAGLWRFNAYTSWEVPDRYSSTRLMYI